MQQCCSLLQFLRNLDDEIQTARFEEQSLCRRLEEKTTHKRIANGHMTSTELKQMLDETQRERLELGGSGLLKPLERT